MNLTLTRYQYGHDGIFGELEGGPFHCYSCERAYPMVDTVNGHNVYAKVPQGSYKCERGFHTLHDGQRFETFEIMGVTGHTGLLFHRGNADTDSQGCVLLGEEIGQYADDTHMLIYSAVAFKAFMALQEGIEEFQLTVIG